MGRLRNIERQCPNVARTRLAAKKQGSIKKKGRRPPPPAYTSHREDPVVSHLECHLSRPWTTIANLCRNPVQYLEAVGTFPPAYLPCHPCQSLCFVLDGQTVSGVARIPRVGSFEMKGKWDLCQLQSIVFAIPELGGIRAGHRIYVAGYLG